MYSHHNLAIKSQFVYSLQRLGYQTHCSMDHIHLFSFLFFVLFAILSFPPRLLFHFISFHLFFFNSSTFFPSPSISFQFACLACYFFVYHLYFYSIHSLLLPSRLSSFVSVVLLASFLLLSLRLFNYF